MPLTPNPRITFKKHAVGIVPVKGEHTLYDNSRTIDLDNVPLNGGFLTKTLVLSAEPYMRVRMRDPAEKAYSTTYVLDAPITSTGVVVVVRSEHPDYKVGDHLVGMTPWELYTVQPYTESRQKNFNTKDWAPWTVNLEDGTGLRQAPNPGNSIPWPRYVNVLGVPGMTAWMALQEYGKMKKGETIFVSSGASAVGLVVVQLAKNAGLRVIASAGSDEKVNTLKSVGVDVAFNYNTEDAEKVLEKEPWIDVYWDNAGGKMLEVAISRAALKGRLIICGGASEYNTPYEQRWGIKNTIEIHRRRLSIFGILLSDLIATHAQGFFTEMPKLVATGAIKSNEQVWKGLENGEDALLAVFTGKNDGKVVVLVSEE